MHHGLKITAFLFLAFVYAGAIARDENASKRVTYSFYGKWIGSSDLCNKIDQRFRGHWTNSVIQFLKFNRADVRPRRPLGIYKTEKSTKHHRLTVDEVQKMGSVASLKEQVVLETLLLGWRIGDVIRLKKADFDVLEREDPIPIRIRASKEGTLYESFISQGFKDLVKLYLPTFKVKWLFPGSDLGTHTKDKTLNRILQKLLYTG